jgi:hypothetical protein
VHHAYLSHMHWNVLAPVPPCRATSLRPSRIQHLSVQQRHPRLRQTGRRAPSLWADCAVMKKAAARKCSAPLLATTRKYWQR